MSNKCEIVKLSEKPILVISSKISQEKFEEAKKIAYSSIKNYLNDVGHELDGELFVVYKGMDIKNLSVDFGCTLSEYVEGRNEIRKDSLPKGKYVSTVFLGEHNKIESTYEELMIYANEAGYETDGRIYEFNIEDGENLKKGEKKIRVMLLLKD
jgi:effector-binding domain-containing protein